MMHQRYAYKKKALDLDNVAGIRCQLFHLCDAYASIFTYYDNNLGLWQ